MNYFELFNIPVSLQVDVTTIKTKFYELSRKYHPDFYLQATEADQEEALDKSSLLNKAFKVFSNREETLKYVLQFKGLLVDEEKYKLPPLFLMEMMELNEMLMDAKMEENDERINNTRLQILSLENELYENIKHTLENYKEGTTPEKELLPVKDYYFKKKYLARILANLK